MHGALCAQQTQQPSGICSRPSQLFSLRHRLPKSNEVQPELSDKSLPGLRLLLFAKSLQAEEFLNIDIKNITFSTFFWLVINLISYVGEFCLIIVFAVLKNNKN